MVEISLKANLKRMLDFLKIWLFREKKGRARQNRFSVTFSGLTRLKHPWVRVIACNLIDGRLIVTYKNSANMPTRKYQILLLVWIHQKASFPQVPVSFSCKHFFSKNSQLDIFKQKGRRRNPVRKHHMLVRRNSRSKRNLPFWNESNRVRINLFDRFFCRTAVKSGCPVSVTKMHWKSTLMKTPISKRLGEEHNNFFMLDQEKSGGMNNFRIPYD